MSYAEKFLGTTSGHAGVKFIIHSPTLNNILEKFHVNFPRECEDPSIVGDEGWFWVADELTFTGPKNIDEVKDWILAFFESYGHYPLERPIYEDDEYQVNLETTPQLVAAIKDNIDKILEETEEFKIVCLEADCFDNYEGVHIHYCDGKFHSEEITIEEIVEFIEFFGLDPEGILNPEDW